MYGAHRFEVVAAVLIAGLAMALVGCAEKSPEERLNEIRSRYSARLNGFYVEETPLVTEETAGGEAEMAEVEAAGEEEAVASEVPVLQRAHLDILVQHDSLEKLPGITVDISMADAQGNEKGHWRLWLDTSKIERANPTQFSHVLEGIDYAPDDGFYVEVRHPVPPEEQAAYREYELGGA